MELMRLHRIDHVSLDVADRARSLAWYEDVLGARAARRNAAPDEPMFLGPAGARLGLFAERAPGLRHIALATDLHGQDAVVARLDAARAPLPARAPPRHHSVYFADPDGTTLEVMVSRP